VPAVEPDIRGATTIRAPLAKHRQQVARAPCHAKIDPPGFALESFESIGCASIPQPAAKRQARSRGWRRCTILGAEVDPAEKFPAARRFRDIDEFRKLLLEDKRTDRPAPSRAAGDLLPPGRAAAGDQRRRGVVRTVRARDLRSADARSRGRFRARVP